MKAWLSLKRPRVAAHLDVVQQFGIHMRTFERDGRMQTCYDGEMFRRVLSVARADAEQRARAALALTRPDCIDPALAVTLRVTLDEERARLLDQIDERALGAMLRGRLHARRAAVWAALAYTQARRAQPPARRFMRLREKRSFLADRGVGKPNSLSSVTPARRSLSVATCSASLTP